MRGLFLKIFAIFWVAQSLIFVISTALILAHGLPHAASMRDPAFTSMHVEASQALKAFDAKGCAGFEAFARAHNEVLALIDNTGAALCGQTALRPPAPTTSTQEIYGQIIGSDTVWAFPVTAGNGKVYRFVTSVHRQKHSWYGDLFHFAFPQLPVAIAVGGLTTFVLVLIFTRPVTRLRNAARQLAQGDLKTRVPERPRTRELFHGDEFDALVHDFNHMAARLESLVDAQQLLLRDVSHELRSPLARLSVALELARDDAAPEMTAHLDRIGREAAKLNQLIGQLLTLSSMEAAEKIDRFHLVSLRSLIDEIIPDAEYEAGQRRSSVSFAANEDCAIAGNRELLYRAIENVVRNAVRYTQPGSEVEIQLRSSETDGRRTAVLEVSDQGPGIPEAEINEIFRPFYRVDRARSTETGGFGVGLAIAERAVKLHGGELRAANRPGGGATIRISFPMPPESTVMRNTLPDKH